MIFFSGISMGGDTGYKPLPSHSLHIFLAPAPFFLVFSIKPFLDCRIFSIAA